MTKIPVVGEHELATCSHCHKVMKSLAINTFDKDGADWFVLETYTINSEGVICFETDENWCGYGLIPNDKDEIENPNEDLTSTIVCPHCRRPIDADCISICRPVMVTVWPRG